MDIKAEIMDDPRRKNHKFDYSKNQSAMPEYGALLASAFSGIDSDAVVEFFELLLQTGKTGKLLFFAGNGGSASIAEHAACDIAKGTFFENRFRIRTVSLTSNTALISAVANDFGYENIFSFQLQNLCMREDVLVLISSSGNSGNVVNAARMAKELGVTTVGLTGFSGGDLRNLVDISLHVDENHYGLVEDAHMAVIHNVIDMLQNRFNNT